ncbi:MAG: carbamoyltransferase N-terminal domain-containing protein [Segetibacter sp.]
MVLTPTMRDSSAAIFVDGVMVAAIEEERFRRVKHWAGFPSLAVQFCLKEAGVTIDRLDHIAIGRDPKAKLFKKVLFLLRNFSGSIDVVKDRIANSKKVTSLEEEFHQLTRADKGQIKQKIHQVEHHRSHLASAFFASPFEEAALLSIDGSGDFTTTMIGIGKEHSIEVIDSVDFPHSIGIFYTAFTQLLGFPNYGDEYKVMGLAPYGEAKYVDKLRTIVNFTDKDLFTLDLSYFKSATEGVISYREDHTPVVAPLFSDKMVATFGEPRKKEEPISQYHKDTGSLCAKTDRTRYLSYLKSFTKKNRASKCLHCGRSSAKQCSQW